METLLLIVNARAGKEQVRSHLLPILNTFTAQGWLTTVHITQYPQDATRVAKELGSRYDRIVCSGGDGTLNEVIAGLMALPRTARPPLGYLPAGSTNDFAASLNLSFDMERAAETAGSGHTFRCDVGTLNDRTFTYIAAFGLFTDVSYETPQEMKNIFGHMAYLLEGVKRMGNIQSSHVTVTHGEETIEDDFIFGMVANTNSVGGFKGLAGKQVVLGDGLFEVLLIKKPLNLLEFNDLIGALISQEVNEKLMYSFKAGALSITGKEPLQWTLDGEFGGTWDTASIKNHRHAITILVDGMRRSNS